MLYTFVFQQRMFLWPFLGEKFGFRFSLFAAVNPLIKP